MPIIPKPKMSKLQKQAQAVQVLNLRKAGKSYDEIAAAVGILEKDAHRIVQRELKRLNDECSNSAEEILRLEIERCYEIVKSLWPRRNEPRSAEVILKTIERISKFYGLDKPLQIEQSIRVDDMDYEQLLAEAERIGLRTIPNKEFEVQNVLPGLDLTALKFLETSRNIEETKVETLKPDDLHNNNENRGV